MGKRKGRGVEDSSHPIADTFRRMADEHRQAVEETLPMAQDWDRFLEAVRDGLANAPGLKQRMGRRGYEALMRGPARGESEPVTLLVELSRTAKYALSSCNLEDLNRGEGHKMKIAGFRIIAASLAVRVVQSATIERATLLDATLQLRELQSAIDTLTRRERVGRYDKAPMYEDAARVKWVREEARTWRAGHPDRPASEGVVFVYRNSKRAGHKGWPTSAALRSWMHRKGIVI